VCRDCWQTLEPWQGLACGGCGLPIPSPQVTASTVPLCAQCRQQEFDFDWARSFGVYGGNLRQAILELKFRRRERLGKRLGELLVEVWTGAEELGALDSPVLVPVPLHASRERERGFNQAQLLAEGLKRGLARVPGTGTPEIAPRCLWRTRATLPQTGLSLTARLENVRGVFDVSVPGIIRGRAAVLIDDVMTTGATLSACAAALKQAGATRVLGLTLARATPDFPDLSGPGPSAPVDDRSRKCG
jgi:competence protein ComFC